MCGSFDPVHVSASWKKIVGKFDDKYFGAVLQSVSRALPGTSQLMELKVCLDQLFLSMSFLQSHGLLAAFRSRWATRHVIVSTLIVRLVVLEAGMKGTILEGSE